MDGHVIIALLLTAGAGLATTIGSILGLVVRRPGKRFLGFTLGFSAGVMILVSFVELLPKAINAPELGFIGAHAAFFAGMFAYMMIDMLVPHDYLGHHDYQEDPQGAALHRAGLMTALGIGIHNFPEGMATFAGAMHDARLGVAIAVAIAIHNVPEGLAVSVPVYAATKSRGQAFLWSFLSGVSEPVGAGVAAVVLLPFLTPAVMGGMMAAVAGIMVAISMDELIPSARDHGSEHTPMLGAIAGMMVMAFSLWMLAMTV
jgi:ZIP family zinc transporter